MTTKTFLSGTKAENNRTRLIHYLSAIIISNFIIVNSFAFDKEQGLRAVTLEYPPYEYIDQNEPTGAAIEIVKEAVKRTGVHTISFEFHPWNWAVSMTKLGKSDLLFNAGKNKERKRWGHYVDSTLILQKYYLFKRKDTHITVNKQFDNVEGQSIAVRLGYLYGDGSFKQAIDNHKFGNIAYTYSTQQSVSLLLKNRVDFFVGDYDPVMHYLEKNDLLSDIDIVKQEDSIDALVVLEWPTYILFSKKNITKTYVDEVNEALEGMKLDGTYHSILEEFSYSDDLNGIND